MLKLRVTVLESLPLFTLAFAAFCVVFNRSISVVSICFLYHISVFNLPLKQK